MQSLLILHEHEQTGRRLHRELGSAYTVYLAGSLEQAREVLASTAIGVLLVSRSLAAASGPAFLDLLGTASPRLRPLVVDAADEAEPDVEAIVARVRELLASGPAASRMEVFATAAHDLRNPLTVILSLTELMLAEGMHDPKEARTFLEAMRTSAEEMRALLDDIQEIVRLEIGRGSLERKPVAVADLLGDAIAAAELEGRATVTAASGSDEIVADRARLAAALGLLLAAVASSAPQRTEIGVTGDDAELCIELRAPGEPLEPSALHELEMSLHRGRRRKDGAETGTGLGPALAARIVEVHGGSITVTSAVGSGTSILVRLPLHAAGD